ncbi:hypothetical protein B0H17DRAFT_411927 [Mycena rosella]|uniref:Uncharacterized protein n=1 Tax=Mycena rosella TaxID=1033263 RepID=A0AAD7GI60_MYCRO|nr:hypothetical protein B0H17DRAFT_411927 [Mycena rosella]
MLRHEACALHRFAGHPSIPAVDAWARIAPYSTTFPGLSVADRYATDVKAQPLLFKGSQCLVPHPRRVFEPLCTLFTCYSP